MCIVFFIVLLLKTGLTICQDLTFLNLDALENIHSKIEDKSIPRYHKYVDIYTNVPDIKKVLNTYKTIKETRRNETKRGIKATEIGKVGFVQNVDRNNYDYSPRPKFKTSKHNFTEAAEATLPFTNIQKIPKKRPLRPQNLQNSLSKILEKYIAKLYAQKQNKQQQQRKEYQTKRTGKKKVQSKFLEEPWRAFKNKTMKLANKFLSLFTIIEFPNSRCQATSASSVYDGICYHRSECENLNGTAIGQCANGYGVCCVCKCCYFISY